MPRTEARIFASIWRDEDFVSLPPSAQRLYLFLLSQDDVAYCGVLPLRQPRWAKKAAGMTVNDIERDLRILEGTANPSDYPPGNPDPVISKTPFLVVDRETGEVLIRALMRRDGVWKQPNLFKQARDTAEPVESPQIRGALLSELYRLPLDESGSDLVRKVAQEFIADLEKGGPYPSAYPPRIRPDDSNGDPPEKSPDDPPQGKGECNGSNQGVPQTPDPLIPESPSMPAPRDRKTGTRLPEGFQPSPSLRAWFSENCPHVDGKREHERFCDYWRGKPGKDGRKLDWDATWRNWMRTAEDRAAPGRKQLGGRPAAPPKQTSFSDEEYESGF